jgi:hypothetical protein
VAQIYLGKPFPVPGEGDIEPALRVQLEKWCATFPVALPLGVADQYRPPAGE